MSVYFLSTRTTWVKAQNLKKIGTVSIQILRLAVCNMSTKKINTFEFKYKNSTENKLEK